MFVGACTRTLCFPEAAPYTKILAADYNAISSILLMIESELVRPDQEVLAVVDWKFRSFHTRDNGMDLGLEEVCSVKRQNSDPIVTQRLNMMRLDRPSSEDSHYWEVQEGLRMVNG